MKTPSAEPRTCPFDDCRRKLRSDNTKGICGYCQQNSRKPPAGAAAAVPDSVREAVAGVVAQRAAAGVGAALPRRGLGDGAKRPPTRGMEHEVDRCGACPMQDAIMERCQHPESVATTGGFGRDCGTAGQTGVPAWCPVVLHGPLLIAVVKRAAA